MNTTRYQYVIDTALRTPTLHDGVYTHQFALFSANLYQCLPDIPDTAHEQLFSRTCAHQALAMAEQGCPEQTVGLAAEPIPPSLTNTPGIIATYHLGSYRLIGRWLAAHHIPFTLVLATKVYRQQGATYQRIIRENAGKDFHFGLLDAEHPLALLHMKRALDAGHHLVVYLDGNTGAGGKKTLGRHGCEVPFLHSRLRVRTGVAHLASMMQCPIYPIVNWRNNNTNSHFYSATPIVVPPDSATRDQAAQNTMAQLYALLAEMVSRYPDQWEVWFYLHHMLALPETEQPHEIAMEGPHWLTFCHGERSYRLNRQTFQCVKMDRSSAR